MKMNTPDSRYQRPVWPAVPTILWQLEWISKRLEQPLQPPRERRGGLFVDSVEVRQWLVKTRTRVGMSN